MTEEAILFVADIVIQKAPEKSAITLTAYITGSLLEGRHGQLSDSIREDVNLLITNKNRQVISRLLKDGFFEVQDYVYGKHVMTHKGEKAKELGGYFKYKEFEEKERIRIETNQAKEAKEFKKVSFPQKYWYVVLILTALTTAIIEKLSQQVWQTKTTQPLPSTLKRIDTVYIYRNDTSVHRNKVTNKTIK